MQSRSTLFPKCFSFGGKILANPSHSAFGALLRPAANGVTLAVRAQPGAKKTAITGLYGEGLAAQLKIAVHAPPIEGRANQALIAFLAESFSIPKSAVELSSGELSRSKVFRLRGVTLEKAEAVLSEWIPKN
jgi:uncharacterized protein (TIGR00251 family)